jgi:hypothetical protein
MSASKPPLDEGKRLVGVDAARQQHHCDRDDGKRQDGRHVERGEKYDSGHRSDGDGGFLPPVGTLGRGGDIDKLHIRGQPIDIGGRALQKERVAHAHHEVVELPPDILVPAVHGQRVDPVAPAQAQVAEAAAHHARARRDQDLHRRGAHLAELVDGLELLRLLQAEDLGHVGPEDHPVARFQLHPGHVPAERGVAPEHVDQAHAVALEQLHLVDVAPDQRGALGHRDLGEEFRPRFPPPAWTPWSCGRAGGGGRTA